MGKNSYQGYVEGIQAIAHYPFNEHQPVSSYSAWVLRDAYQHMLDQSGQYRVNFVADTDYQSNMPAASGTAGASLELRYPFHLAQIHPSRPFRLDIRIGTVVGHVDDTLTLRARLIPRNAAGVVLWSAESIGDSTTTPGWTIDQLATWTTENRHVLGGVSLTGMTTETNHPVDRVKIELVELVIDAFFDPGDSHSEGPTGWVVGVQAREFP